MKHSVLLASLLVSGVAAFSSQRAFAAGEEYLLFGYCDDYASALGNTSGSSTTAMAAIEIPAELALKWEGANMQQVHIGYGTSPDTQVTVFLTYDLEKEPFYTQEAKLTTQAGWNVVDLTNPVEIGAQPFYVGYSVTTTTPGGKPIGVDNISTTETYGDLVNIYDEWEHVGKHYGNVCIRVALSGDNLPQNCASVIEVDSPEYIQAGKPFSATLTILNNGVKPISSASVEAKIGEESQKNLTVTVPEEIPSGYQGVIEVSGLMVSETGENLSLEISVIGINGQANEEEVENAGQVSVNISEVVYPQNVLVEEFTGTWCGWCPMGIVGLEYMNEHYAKDGFIAMAGHYGDEMQADSYADFVMTASSGRFPGSVINRQYFSYPDSESLEDYFKLASKYPAAMGVTSLKANYDKGGKKVDVDSEVTFSFPQENAAYKMAYALVENNVGPYVQSNDYSGSTTEILEGWNNKPASVVTMYNDVVRDVNSAYGIDGSVPAKLNALQPYEYKASLSTDNVADIKNCYVVAFILDSETGFVMNSAQLVLYPGETGVEDIEVSPADELFRVYTPQGLKVLETRNSSELKELPAGIYIINGKKVKL